MRSGSIPYGSSDSRWSVSALSGDAADAVSADAEADLETAIARKIRSVSSDITRPARLDYAYPSEVGRRFGFSRWSTPREFTRTLTPVTVKSSRKESIGGMVLKSDTETAWVDGNDSHSIVFGATGSQKSRRIIMPSILSLAKSGESMVISDPKGELMEYTAGFLEKKGYKVYNLNLRDPICSDGWNPLALPYEMYRSDNPSESALGENMVNDLATTLMPVINQSDPYWDEAAQNLIASCIRTVFDCCDDISKVNMASIQDLFDVLEPDGSPIARKFLGSSRASRQIRSGMSGVVNNAESTKRCILGVARKAIRPYCSHRLIENILSDNEIDPRKLADGKVAVFISVPEDRDTYNALVSSFVKTAYSALIDIAYKSPGRRLKNGVSFLLDEFGSFPEIPGLISMVTSARSRGIRFNFVMQGLGQLSSKYGDVGAMTIIGNCTNVVFVTSREYDLMTYMCQLAGTDGDGRDMVSVAGLQRLDKESGEILVFHDREYPFLSNVVDISEYCVPEYRTSRKLRERYEVKVFSLENYVYNGEP